MVATPKSPRNDGVYVPAGSRKRHVVSERLLWTCSTFTKSDALRDTCISFLQTFAPKQSRSEPGCLPNVGNNAAAERPYEG